jgi:hypothetical protein
MLEYLKELKNDPDGPFDIIYFLPGEEENNLHLEGRVFKDPGEKVGGSELGDCYTIILFKEDVENDGFYELDTFDAILADPYEYMSGLIPQDWYGVFTKKTTKSEEYVKSMLDKLATI